MKDETLYNLFKNLIFEISPLIDKAISSKFFKPKFQNYPKVTFEKNGMPNISKFGNDSPSKVTDLFRKFGERADIELTEYKSYNVLKEYLLNHTEYRDCIYPDNVNEEDRDKVFNLLGSTLIEELLERYYILNKDKKENEILLSSIYLPVENYIYAKDLYFDISIPILFLNFDISEYRITDNIILRRIQDDYHKARFGIRSYSPPVTDAIISGATHELVFKNYYIKKGKKYFDTSLSNENVYPVYEFELFFNAIKIVTNQNSGFAQILAYPHDWVDYYYMDLPILKGTSVRKYPNYFDNYYWNNETLNKLDQQQIEKVAKIFINLLNNNNNKIQISNKRLRSSYLRDNDEDSILDIIIALETLLSDQENGEVTHKLALRIAKLISVHNKDYDPMQVFNAVKKIYAFRSAVVHGSSKKIDSKKEIKLHEESEPISTISLANDFLREVIGILVEHPKFLDSKEVDKLLLI